MRTLTDVFAPGTPLLPEGLRTLQVSPGRVVQPGETVHAQFTFRNLGGGTATGFRVRFRLPEGLTYLVGTATIDGQPLGEASGLSALLQSSGADIGDIPAGSERRIALAYTVATTIENGTPITLQAAISSFEVPVIGSNVVRLVVRSKPALQNPSTKLTAVPVRETVPGQELQLKAQVHNSGQSSAHDAIVLLPVPANTSYVADSASAGGHPAGAASDTDPFGFGRPTIAVPTLGPGATIDVAYRVRIDPVLEDGTPIVVRAAVCSQEVGEFALAPVTLKVVSVPSFGGPETDFAADCEDEVVPGQRIRFVLRARNAGTAPARGVRLVVSLPDGLAYSAGSRFVDGAPTVAAAAEPGVFALGDLEPGRSVEVALSALVVSPQANGHELALGGAVEWSKGRRGFERVVTVRSAPLFPAAFNDLVRESPRLLEPRDAAVCVVHLANMGTDVATGVRLLLEADPGLEGVRVRDGEREVPLGDDGALYLDTLEPGAPRTLRVEARIAAVMEDQAQVRLRATLRTAQLDPLEVGSVVHVVASRPRFAAATSRLELASNEVLRPNRTTACRLTLVNDGTDAGRDIRVRLQLPEELRLESVEGASRDGHSIVFGQVPAGESREALVHLRLVTTIAHGDVLEVAGRVSGLNVVPFALETMRVATHAEPSFADAATLTSLPAEAIDAGAELTYVLALRNSGDGAAKRLTARLEAPAKTVYAPGSTTVNDVALLDFAGTSPLLTPNGLTLSDVGPGVEVIARLRVIVNTPLPAGTTIEARARVAWDETPELLLSAEPVRVRSAAAFQIVEPQLPFSVLDAAAAPERPLGAQRELPPAREPGTLQLPPATPIRPNGTQEHGREHGARAALEPAARADETVLLELTPERLEWIVPYLREARFPGLLPHLLLLRALFPADALDADAVLRARLRRHGELMSELIDGLFIKLRLPGAQTAPEDLETRELRGSLRGVLESLARERELGLGDPGGEELRLTGVVRYDELGAAVGALEREPLMTATPWLALSIVMGTTLERGGEVLGDFTAYRSLLQQTLAGMGRLSAAEFHAALSEPADPRLDAERGALVDALAEQQQAPT